jgi:membrane-bound lytic murein transglycosylase D
MPAAAKAAAPESSRSAPAAAAAGAKRPRAIDPGPRAVDDDPDCLIAGEDEVPPGPSQSKEERFNHALALCRVSRLHWQRGDLDKAVEALDEAYATILDVDPENDPGLLQEKEDLRISISKRIIEIYSSRQVVMNGRRNEIPLTLNRHVQDEIDSFTTGRERDFFLEAYRRSGKFRPRIEAALKAAGLPAELSWLPLIESGFKLTALSPARALGLWQFIPSTGYRYGLNRDTYIDERLDPEKATRAAIDYLKDLHAMFGDWMTVLAAYNCGEHRVMRTIQSQNIDYLDHFWDLYERLPRETARYVPRFLATLHIVGAPQQYGLDEAVLAPPLPFETVVVPRQTSLKAIARTAEIDEGLLRELNSELRQGILPAGGYELKVPEGDGEALLARLDDLPPASAAELDPPRAAAAVIEHKVRRGETLAALSRRYGVELKSLLAANQMRRDAPLAPGKVVRIPAGACPPGRPAAAPAGRAPLAKPEMAEHVVRHGDSLWNLARRYNTTVEEIQRLNQVTPATIAVGQALRIPKAEAPRTEPARPDRQPPKPKTHVVRKGETLAAIAKTHHTSAEQLAKVNRLARGAALQPGQVLVVE